MANFLADNTPDDTDPINPYDQSPNQQPKIQNPYLTGASRWQNKRLSNHYTRRVGSGGSRFLKKMDLLASATSAELASRTGSASSRQAAAIKLSKLRLADTPGIEGAAAAKAKATASKVRKARASATARATAAKSVKANRAARATKAAKARKAG